MQDQDPRLREDVLEFLREKAFPTWDFFDATTRRRLLEEYPGQQIAEEVARRLRELGRFNPQVQLPFRFRPSYQITVTALRPARPPDRGLLAALRRPDNSIEARDTGTRVIVTNLSAIGPFALAVYLWPAGAFEPPLDPVAMEDAVRDILRGEHLAVLTREEGMVPVRGMKGTPYSTEGRIPNVIDCLFDSTSFLMRGLGVKQFRSQEEGDLWPTLVEDSTGRQGL